MTYDVNCRIAHHQLLAAYREELMASIRRDVMEPRKEQLSEPVLERIYTHFMGDADCSALRRHMLEAGIERAAIFVEPKGEQPSLEAVGRALEHVGATRAIDDAFDFVLPCPLQDPGAIDQLCAWAVQQNAVGAWVSWGDLEELPAGRLAQLARVCRELRLYLAVDLRTQTPSHHDALPRVLGDALESLHGFPLLLASAGFLSREAVAALPRATNLYLDVTGFQSQDRRAAEGASSWLAWTIETYPTQTLFGSGWPRYYFRGKQRHWVEAIRKASVTSEQADRVTQHNHRAFVQSRSSS